MKTTFTVYTVFFFLLITMLSVSSCRGDSDMLDATFSKVEKCMDALPDSALKLLKTIPDSENLHGESQARYALLMTQAMDKNYMKFSSDSLIVLALNYYTVNQRSPAMYAKSLFYYGRVMQELDRQEDALKCFLKAKKYYDKTKEYKMLALITEEIGIINRIQKLYDEALINFQESLYIHKCIKDTLSILRANQNIARAYLFKKQWDSCFYYYNEALIIARKKKSDSEISILHELGVLYREKGDLPKAESYFLSALNRETNRDKVYQKYFSLGYLYLQMNKIGSAREYIRKSLESSLLTTQRDAYECLSWLEKEEENYKLAMDYNEKSDSINSILEKQNSQDLIVDLQKKYDNEKLRNENLEIRIKFTNIIWIGSIAFWAVVIFMCYYYYKNRANKKRVVEIERQISGNKEQIIRYQKELEEIQELKDQALIENKVKEGELNGKIMLLTTQNKILTEQLIEKRGEVEVEIISEHYIPILRVLIAMKEGTLRGKLSNQDWEKLFSLFDFLYMDYVNRLKQYCPSLTKHDLEICCLLKFGFSNEELGRVFLTTSDSVTKAKGRLKGRLGVSPHENLDAFLKRF